MHGGVFGCKADFDSHPPLLSHGGSFVPFEYFEGVVISQGSYSGVFRDCDNEAMSELFPEDTMRIVGLSQDLNCFVMEGVENAFDISADEILIFLAKLARIQRDSMEHLDGLRRLGMPDYSPGIMAEKLKAWLQNVDVMDVLREQELDWDEFLGACEKVCLALNDSAISVSVVHGDYCLRNIGRRAGITQDCGLVVYDWQMAHVSHPFCDMLACANLMPTEQWEVYVEIWLEYVTEEEAEVEKELADVLACMARVDRSIAYAQLGTYSNQCSYRDQASLYTQKICSYVKTGALS